MISALSVLDTWLPLPPYPTTSEYPHEEGGLIPSCFVRSIDPERLSDILHDTSSRVFNLGLASTLPTGQALLVASH